MHLAHEIGVKLAKEMWGDRFEIIVTTHLDKEHIHCHFCFNSVSFRDGGKYNYSKAERKRMMEISDRLCREYGLSVIEMSHKAPSRSVWLDTLNERWVLENIRCSMGRYATFGNRRAYISYPPQMPQELSDWFQPFHKTSHIYKLYLHYCYLLGYLPKHTDYKPTSPYLKEDLRKLDDLYADREKIQGDMDSLISRRTKLKNKILRAVPAEKEILRQEKAGVTEQITALRKQLKLNKAIEVRSAKIQEKTDLYFANEIRAKEAKRQKKPQRKERDAR